MKGKVYTVGFNLRGEDKPTSRTFVALAGAEAFARIMASSPLVDKVRYPVPRDVHSSGTAEAKRILKDAREWEEVCSAEVGGYREDDRGKEVME